MHPIETVCVKTLRQVKPGKLLHGSFETYSPGWPLHKSKEACSL